METHSRILAWITLWTEKAGGAKEHGVGKSQTQTQVTEQACIHKEIRIACICQSTTLYVPKMYI